jgi:type VI protein secretion system component VasK
MNYLLTFVADLDWRIVAIAVAGLLVWRRADLAALWTKRKLTTEGTEKKAIADPIDALLAGVEQRRGEIVAELRTLETRLDELEAQLTRIDQLFARETTSISVPVPPPAPVTHVHGSP